ncbi:MAG: extracellular solute-binding protein [Eubacteriales bacterium]|nr:extracellular solute-binding protein [Eubacteriales bacterium]
MKKMMKKATAMTVMASMAMTLFSGAMVANASEGAYTDYSEGFPERVTIQIPVYDRAFEGWNVTDNYYTQWIQQEFGEKYNVNVEYVAIGRTTEVQDFMQLIAAQNAPDIIFHYDMPQAVNYYQEGAFQELDLDEIAYYAPTYYEQLGETIQKYGQLDGETIFAFAGRDAIYYNYVNLIRKDWLDQVGMEMPTNREELEEVLRAWQEAGLGNYTEQLWQKSFTMEYPFISDDVTEEELALYLDLNVAPLTWQPTEDFLRTWNAEYNEGLIDPEFYLNKEEQDWKADFVSGNSGIFSFYINSSTDVITSLLANNPDAEVAVMPATAKSPYGNANYYEYPPYGLILGVNYQTTDMERAALWMFLDWMIQPENLFYLQNGVEGQNYELDEDGIAVPIEGYDGESKLSPNNNKDYYALVCEIANYGDDELNFKANLKTLAPAGYESLIEDSYNTQIPEDGIVTPIFTKAIESSSEYASDLNAMWQEFAVDLITCAPEEFDAKYEEYCQEYLDGGYQAILDEKQALLDEGSYIAE